MKSVRHESVAPRSRVKHSTTALPTEEGSHEIKNSIHGENQNKRFSEPLETTHSNC